MEPVTSVIVTRAASDISEAAKESGKSFLSAVLRPPGEALGGIYADQLNERRHANLIKIAARAQERLKEAGLTAKQVPLSIIHPALEAASLEEDFDLQEVWAHLLANAADPLAAAPRVIPAYAAILGELTSPDVKFLNHFCIHFEHSRHPKSTPLRLAVDQFGARPLSAVQRARRAEVAPADGTCNDLITN